MIQVENLIKEYKTIQKQPGFLGSLKSLIFPERLIKRAIDQVNLNIKAGSITGIIGPNGAGKSTLMKMLTGILRETSGNINVFGCHPNRNRIANAKQIGAVFGQRTNLYWDLPLNQSFAFARDIYGIPPKLFNENLQKMISIFDLNPLLKVPVRELSLGQRLRGDLAMVLLHNPMILYLDEPTIGLDILGKDSLRKYLLEINSREHTTIIIATHDLYDLEKLCQQILVLDHGKVVYDGEIKKLIENYPVDTTLIVDLASGGKEFKIKKGAIEKSNLNRYWVRYNPREISNADMVKNIIRNYEIIDIRIEEPRIEEIIKNIYANL